MKIAFVGLGAMGLPMACRLLAAGHSVNGYDISEHNRAAFEAANGKWSTPEQDLLGAVDVLWLMVVSGQQAADFLHPEKVLAHLPKGTPIIVSCTQAPAAAAALGNTLAQAGLPMLDAPVSGGVVGAQNGSLSIMLGGSDELVAQLKPLLELVGKNIFHTGKTCGMGSTMKMINQLLCGVHIAAAAEAMHLAGNCGLDLQQVFEIISVSAGNSWMWGNRGPRMLQEDPPVTSAVDIFVKDLGIVADEGHSHNVALPLVSVALSRFVAASKQGHGKADDSQVIRAYRQANAA